MNSVSVDFDDHGIIEYLNHAINRLYDTSSLMADIAEFGAETTKRRFDTSTAPDGSKWERNSLVTIERYLSFYSNRSNDTARSNAKKPLIGETRSLMSTIFPNWGIGFAEWGSPLEYSAMMQFGGTVAEFPHLWGDIPARVFLGISDDDAQGILSIVDSYLSN